MLTLSSWPKGMRVIAPKEREWLDTPLPAVQNRRPADVIAGGKLRDLIVEFQRLREGQAV